MAVTVDVELWPLWTVSDTIGAVAYKMHAVRRFEAVNLTIDGSHGYDRVLTRCGVSKLAVVQVDFPRSWDPICGSCLHSLQAVVGQITWPSVHRRAQRIAFTVLDVRPYTRTRRRKKPATLTMLANGTLIHARDHG